MPRPPTVTETRLKNIIASLKPGIKLINELHDAFESPFLPAVSSITVSLMTLLENIKKNKEETIQLMENIHAVLYAIIDLHLRSEPAGNIPPVMLYHMGHFTETLQKIHTFVESQQQGNKITQFFRRHIEMNTLLKGCQDGLQQAMEVFKIESSATVLTNIVEVQKKAENMHNQLLKLISSLSDETSTDKDFSIYRTLNSSQMSSRSFSMLPPRPKIFHGRNSEVNHIVNIFNQESPRIAILGAGGMGKTCLARAVLHHPDPPQLTWLQLLGNIWV
ncbi:hypothetical protein MVEN_02552700 [Mycena venus]|uniref:NB-ARC domain-containing protein n=1 Tax=Mycena venus TaxID=2733690 RepID=A0A8H6U3D5_9AGAR|nr:hypothetical protein MVEN_02552700 [Mycena venus]